MRIGDFKTLTPTLSHREREIYSRLPTGNQIVKERTRRRATGDTRENLDFSRSAAPLKITYTRVHVNAIFGPPGAITNTSTKRKRVCDFEGY